MSESIGQIAVRTNGCTYCKAWPGEPCKTKNGHRAGYAHAARCAPVLAGWHDGYEGMAKDVLGMGAERGMKYAERIVRNSRFRPAAPSECQCAPCPGRGNDGHGMTHCAECCFGTGVEAEPDCPIHGESRIRSAAEAQGGDS